jgi:hypothetical protein
MTATILGFYPYDKTLENMLLDRWYF